MNLRKMLTQAKNVIGEQVRKSNVKPPPPPKRDYGAINARRQKTRDAYINHLNERMNKRMK